MVRVLLAETAETAGIDPRRRWLAAVSSRVCAERPDLAPGLITILGMNPQASGELTDLSIGEIGVCYEAFLATTDPQARREAGQFFTPDDVAAFMAGHAADFPTGTWLDPCCGVGNLAWHLVAAHPNPGDFVREQLYLLDQDPVALKTAVALLGAQFLAPGDLDGLQGLHRHAACADFLNVRHLPRTDFVIANPPYARAVQMPKFETGKTGNLFAYFLERITKNSRGLIAVTPASFLSRQKFQSLREILEREMSGGRVYVFDNVPDTLFRGFKFGSANTSKTNFVRGAITVSTPHEDTWQLTPILRWSASSRGRMLAGAAGFLLPRRLGPYGEWVKLLGELAPTWEALAAAKTCIGDLVTGEKTEYSLTVATTPRYYISASYRDLERSSKAILYFATAKNRDRAALVLNSDIPYLWWRALDGGVTLPMRVLMSTPVPDFAPAPALTRRLRKEEETGRTQKLNAGRLNENVKRDRALVAELNRHILGLGAGVSLPIDRLYAADMFA